MEVTGKILSSRVVLQEARIPFKCEVDVESISAAIIDILEMPLTITVNESFTVEAEIHEFNSRKRRVVLFLIVSTADSNIKRLLSLEGRGRIYLEIVVDKSKPLPEKRIDLSYSIVLKRMIRQLAISIGKLPDEMEKIMKHTWGNVSMHIENMTISQANSFRDVLLDWGERTGTTYDIESDTYAVKKWIEIRRKDGLCSVCEEKSAVSKYALFPICEKHHREYLVDPDKFIAKYHLA